MAEFSKIGWTTHTFNPWRGCTKVSPACTNCYAERQSKRNPRVLGIWGDHGTRVLASGGQWKEPIKWNRYQETSPDRPRPRIFCASLADVFEDFPGRVSDSSGRVLYINPNNGNVRGVGDTVGPSWDTDPAYQPFTLDDARDKLWELIRKTPNLDWLLLTKRPENIVRMMPSGEWPNVWLGTTIESEEYKVRADQLLEAAQVVRVPVRFVSAEPLLSPVDLGASLSPEGINWLIVGGESGAYEKVRPFYLKDGEFMVKQAQAARVGVFMKQLGTKPWMNTIQWVLPGNDTKGEELNSMPQKLQVRQNPTRSVK